jgi:hypothetical protein
MLEEISRLLAQIGSSGSFATRRTAATEDLNLEIQGVGSIRFPVSPTTARRLSEVARPARHGFKDQTRLDRRVRDTWEIPKSRITIDELRWKKTLTPQLDRIRRDLGLPDGCRLKAQLHNLLVYGPGQFFATHQDSEKADGMIGTLVVNLPSKFTGGAMSITHHENKKLIGGSGRSLTFIAFYADCHHEVRPIKQGYRVALTYNLIAEGKGTAAGAPMARMEALTQRIRDFFDTPHPPRRYSDRTPGPPDRLVYLLDHQYTQHGLAWSRLKNSDAARAAALRDVAAHLDCEIFLALADVHETWSCEEEDYDRHGYRWDRDYHDDDEEDEDAEPDDGSSGTPELTELIDSDIELRHWIGPGKRPGAVAAGVSADELCYTRPSAELEPFESEHEGYMGNEGNTVDRWYHRAAVVLWPRERTFVIRAKASPRWGIGQVEKKLKAGAGTAAGEALALAQRLLPFWAQVGGRDADRALIDGTLMVAAKLGDPKVAAALLAPFTLTGVSAKAAPRLADLLDRYGTDWCRALLRQWASESTVYQAPQTRTAWIGSALPQLCRSLCARTSSDGQALVRGIVMDQWAWVLDQLKDIRRYESFKEMTQELARLSKPILALIDSSRIAKHADLHRQMIGFLTADAIDEPLTRLRLGLLRTAHDRHQPDRLRSLGLRPVHARCSEDLATRLNVPPRLKDDWSITTSVRCSCELCATLTRYLRASDRVRLEWPLAQAQRAHIHGIVDSRELPVRHTTRRTGRPFTLILEKTAAVFERDVADRRSWQNDLQWLKRTTGDF